LGSLSSYKKYADKALGDIFEDAAECFLYSFFDCQLTAVCWQRLDGRFVI